MRLCPKTVVAAALLALPPGGLAEPAVVGVAEFRAGVGQMQGLVAACAQNAGACDSQKVVHDQRVGDPKVAGSFAMRWEWLRSALDTAKKVKADERTQQMGEAAARLNAMVQETGGQTGAKDSGDFAKTRAQTDAILAGPEFARDAGPGWFAQKVARFGKWFGHLFEGVNLPAVPWLGTLLEYALILAAASGLAYFVMRSFSQQRMRVSLSSGAALTSAWEIESADWARLAEEAAAAGDWREAVHGLYWAAIILLESRRAWRHNPSRTPREYVRLLKPGSVQRESLRGLTRMFERVWYGFEAADGAEYARARGMFDGLSSASAAESSAAGEAA